ncbi:unnamed protein product, partial [Ceratitis capitata]
MTMLQMVYLLGQTDGYVSGLLLEFVSLVFFYGCSFVCIFLSGFSGFKALSPPNETGK